MEAERTLDASHVITTPESLKAVSQELANEFSVESLTTPAVKNKSLLCTPPPSHFDEVESN